MSDAKTVVIGVGPALGLGAALCRRFGASGHHVFVAGRTPASLEAVCASIRDAGGEATAVRTDATKEAEVVALLEQVEAAPGTLEVAIYNTGNNTPGRIVDMEASYFERAWRLGAFGGFLFGREAVRRMLPRRRGTLMFTGASASWRGRAGFGAFNSSKAALRNLAMAMAKEYAADGIHVAHVVVDGGIHGDKILQRVPELVERMGTDGLISIEGLAEAYWFLYQQPPQAWTFELDQRTFKESW